MPEKQPPSTEPYFAYISEDADDALEYIFEHPDGVSERNLARALGLTKSDFLIDELRLAGIEVRTEVRDGEMIYLAPLRKTKN